MVTTLQTEADAAGSGPAAPEPARPRPSQNAYTLALSGVIFGLFALAASIFAVALAGQAAREARQRSAAPTGGASAAATATVALREFALQPTSLTISAGTALRVQNTGTIVHNLSVDGIAAPMLDKGASADLDLSALRPGSYTMRCDVVGHEAAGMKGVLTIQ